MGNSKLFLQTVERLLSRIASANQVNDKLITCVHFAREIEADRIEYHFFDCFPESDSLIAATKEAIDKAALDAGFTGTTFYYRA